ncbi:MAG: urea carboxylase-associated family protein [Halofilum sp. (in: g-proteobacteria)]
MAEQLTIPARRGAAQRVARGQTIRVINTHGSQVVDTWAFNADDPSEFMSMEHTRPTLGKIIPDPGDSLVTNRRRPILTLTEDTTPGVHDTLVAACDRYRYELLGAKEYHDNCTDNLVEAVRTLGLDVPEVPAPLNLFMNVPVADGRAIRFEAPVSKPGDYVELRAEMDLVVAFSACPQDMIPVNGEHLTITDAHFTVT